MKISVILPVCDAPIESGRPHYWLRHCIQSVLDGGHDDFELLVGCDGDTPRIREVVESWQDARLKYVAFPRTRSWGNYQCHHLLKSHATGDLVMWMNHDDSYVPGALRIAHDEAEALPGRAFFFRARLRVGVETWWKRDPRLKQNAHVLATVTPRLPYIPPYGTSCERSAAEDLAWTIAVHTYYESIGKPVIWVPTVLVLVRPWAPPEMMASWGALEAPLQVST